MEPPNTFLRQAQAESLDPHEKMLTRVRLQNFMEKHPARGKTGWSMLWFRLTAVATSVCLLAAGGGAAAYAAENAEPGEALYGVKRYVNEPVMLALAFDTEAKANVHSRILQRRLREIESIILRGGMHADSATEEDLRANIEYHLGAARENITLLSQEHPDAAAAENARVEAELDAHAAILTTLTEASAPDIRPFLMKVTTAVNGAAKVATDTRTSYETVDEKASRISAEASLDQSERGLAEAERALDRMHGIADERSLLRAKKKLEEAKAELSEGKATLEAKGFGDALERGRLARRKAEESRVMAVSGDNDASTESTSSSAASKQVEASASVDVGADAEIDPESLLH